MARTALVNILKSATLLNVNIVWISGKHRTSHLLWPQKSGLTSAVNATSDPQYSSNRIIILPRKALSDHTSSLPHIVTYTQNDCVQVQASLRLSTCLLPNVTFYCDSTTEVKSKKTRAHAHTHRKREKISRTFFNGHMIRVGDIFNLPNATKPSQSFYARLSPVRGASEQQCCCQLLVCEVKSKNVYRPSERCEDGDVLLFSVSLSTGALA